MERVSVNADQMQVFVTINNIGMMVNAGVNVKNRLVNVYVIRNIFGILVTVSVNVINHVMLEIIWIVKIVSVRKNQLIIQLKNELKLLKK